MLKKSRISTKILWLSLGVIVTLNQTYLPLRAMDDERDGLVDQYGWYGEEMEDQSAPYVGGNDADAQIGPQGDDIQGPLDLEAANGVLGNVDEEKHREPEGYQQLIEIHNSGANQPAGNSGKNGGREEALQLINGQIHENNRVLDDIKTKRVEKGSMLSPLKNPWVVGGFVLAAAAGAGYWFKDQIAEAVGLQGPQDSDDEEDSDEQEAHATKAGWTTKQKTALGLAAAGGATATYLAYQNREALSEAGKEKTDRLCTYVRENPGKTFVGGALAGALIYGVRSLSTQKNDEREREASDTHSEYKQTLSLSSFMQQTTEPPTLNKRVKAQFEKLNNAFVSSLKEKVSQKKRTSVFVRVKTVMNPTYYFCYGFNKNLTAEQRQILWQLVQFFVTNILPHMNLDTVEYAHYKFLGSLGLEHYRNHLFEAFRKFITEKTVAYYSPMEMLSDKEKKARKEFIAVVVQAKQKFGW